MKSTFLYLLTIFVTQRTLSKFSQAASAIEPSDAGSIFSNQHKSQKKKRRQMDDDEFLGHSSTKKLNQEGPTRKKSKSSLTTP